MQIALTIIAIAEIISLVFTFLYLTRAFKIVQKKGPGIDGICKKLCISFSSLLVLYFASGVIAMYARGTFAIYTILISLLSVLLPGIVGYWVIWLLWKNGKATKPK